MRLALNYAIDRNAIVKLAYSGHAIAGLVVHAVQDAVLELVAEAVPVRPREGEGAAREVEVPERLQDAS